MKRALLLVPSIDPDVAHLSLSSFRPSLVGTSTTAVVVYNGDDHRIESDLSGPHVVMIGCQDSERIAVAFAQLAGCAKELLFGDQNYNRSFGGASNLLLGIGIALGASHLAKVDDDCRDVRPTTHSWMSCALESRRPRTVRFGAYTGEQSGSLAGIPRRTRYELAGFIYPVAQRSARLGCTEAPVMKNGNLVIPRGAAMAAPYPVLFDPGTGTHVRGEIFLWKDELERGGFSFEYDELLALDHRRQRRSVSDWLRSIVAGFDLWYVHGFGKREGRAPTSAERRSAISTFRSWMLSADWPTGVTVRELAALLDDTGLDFTERVLREMELRRVAWRLLMHCDLVSALRDVLPALASRAHRPHV